MAEEYSAYYQSPIGWIKIIETAGAIKALDFIDDPGERENDE
jgi:hypothetical protein